jgi:perosamine synthetase
VTDTLKNFDMSGTVTAYPTLAGFRHAGRLRARGKPWFPFSADVPGGWAFSGRVALYHGVRLLHLPTPSTILVPSYHEGVELDALIAAGYRVRYYRVDPGLRIDFGDVARNLDADVSALYLTHYFGIPQPVTAAREFCNTHGLRLIEDCALALFGQTPDDTWLGSVGDLAIFSIYKTLPVPHGGYYVTNSATGLPRNGNGNGKLRSPPFKSTLVQSLDLVHHTLDATGWSGIERAATRAAAAVKRTLGWNRGTTVASGGPRWDARLVDYGVSSWTRRLVRFTDPERVVRRRRANYAQLAKSLRREISVPFPELPLGTCPLSLPILVRERDRVHDRLTAQGIEAGKYWPVSHPTCPEDLAAEMSLWRDHCLELPIHQELTKEDMDRVAEAVLTALH